MNARNTLFAMFALGSLAAPALAQEWTSEATVSCCQPASVTVTCSPMTYVRPAYLQPVVYTQPRFVAQPVIAYYPPVYRPVVASYTPPCVASSATCEVPLARPVVSAAPAGPKVWVHEKVYVQGRPLRNLFTAITP